MAVDSNPPAIITLTTDFGTGSRYIGAMKGVILSINPRATIIDLSHTVPAQNIRAGAIVLAETAPWFPPDSIDVAVVDPGVGSNRRIVYARIGSQQFVPQDNGLLSRLALLERPKNNQHRRTAILDASRVADVSRAPYHGPRRRPAKCGTFARLTGPPTPAARGNALGGGAASV